MRFDPSWLRLMAITPEPSDPEALLRAVSAAVRGGATCIEVRAKKLDSRALVALTRAVIARVQVPVIVNDRADVAIAADAAGVHLGIEDIPPAVVRSFAPAGFVIGASVGLDAELPLAEGADYVSVGPVFATDSKADAGSAIGVAEMARLIHASGRPGVGIGGITPANAAEVIAAGADGVAVLSAIFSARDPEAAALALASASER